MKTVGLVFFEKMNYKVVVNIDIEKANVEELYDFFKGFNFEGFEEEDILYYETASERYFYNFKIDMIDHGRKKVLLEVI